MVSLTPTVCVRCSATVAVSLAPTVIVRLAPMVMVSLTPTFSVRFTPIVIVSLLPTLSVRLTPIVIVSLLSTVSVRSCLTCVVSSWSIVFVRSWPTQCVSSFSTSMSWFFSACRKTCSEPFLSSKRISLQLAPAPPLARARLDARLRHVGRQIVGRHLLGVVDAAGDDRLVRIAFEEIDDHLLADARDRDHAPALARPRMRDADPARAVLVLLAVAVPVELHLHAAVLVGVDLVAARADHDRGLRPLHERLRRAAPRPELLPLLSTTEAAIDSWRRRSSIASYSLNSSRSIRRHHQVLAVLIAPRMPVEREQIADATRRARWCPPCAVRTGLQLVDPRPT